MRPVHILLLVLAGAIGGAVIMKFVPRPRAVVLAPAVAQVQAPAPVAPPAAPPQPVPVPEATKPSPIPARREAPKPLRFYHKPAAHVTVTAVPRPLPALAQAPALAPPSTSGPTITPPPVRTEPENVTPGSPEGPVAPAPPPRQVTLNAGLLIPVRLVDGLSSERNAPGDAFSATLDRELVVDDLVIAERGAQVEGRVVAVDPAGRLRGVATIAVELARVHTSDGQAVPVESETFEKRAPAALPTQTQITFRVKTPVTVTERR
ncbi:MAG TPA: hypothetical protein VLY04_14265 [Bryobacteraceae bacterium]|nr:hypothetical protein [Bryobacteraceae bacterium]